MIGSALAPCLALVLAKRFPLPPLARVIGGVLVSHFALGQPLQPDAEPRRVHHDEHRLQALLALADEPALRAVVVHHAGRVAVDAHLLLERAARNGVALAERAVVVHEELGHDEEADPLDVVGRAGALGEDEVDDVLAKVVLA